MIKKQRLQILLLTALIGQQAQTSQTNVHDHVDTSERLKAALHDESYSAVKILMQKTAQRTAKSDLDRACDELIIWTNCHPFDQEKYDQLMSAIFAAQQTNIRNK